MTGEAQNSEGIYGQVSQNILHFLNLPGDLKQLVLFPSIAHLQQDCMKNCVHVSINSAVSTGKNVRTQHVDMSYVHSSFNFSRQH